MGENSARQMRGEGMDDVIFSGSNERPARNFAEVTIKLDNTEKNAPASFNQFDEIEIQEKLNERKVRLIGLILNKLDLEMYN